MYLLVMFNSITMYSNHCERAGLVTSQSQELNDLPASASFMGNNRVEGLPESNSCPQNAT